jgi:hypothetical protein
MNTYLTSLCWNHDANMFLLFVHLGTGAVYSFDPVGSYEREACRAAGAAQALVQPFLDNQVSINSWTADDARTVWPPCLLPISRHPILYRFRTVLPLQNCAIPSSAGLYRVGLLTNITTVFLQIYFKNQTPAPGTSFPRHLPLSTVLPLVIDSFTSATERHIEVRFDCLFPHSIHIVLDSISPFFTSFCGVFLP